MEKSFQIGDVIVYKAIGVFRIVAIGMPSFAHDKRQTYFTLKELCSKNPSETLYVPTGSAALLRPVISRERAEMYLDGFAQLQPDASMSSVPLKIAARYQSIIETYDVTEQLKLLKWIYLKKHSLSKGQKLPEIDVQSRDIIEKVICDEFSVVLDVPPEQIKKMLQTSLKLKKSMKPKS